MFVHVQKSVAGTCFFPEYKGIGSHFLIDGDVQNASFFIGKNYKKHLSILFFQFVLILLE